MFRQLTGVLQHFGNLNNVDEKLNTVLDTQEGSAVEDGAKVGSDSSVLGKHGNCVSATVEGLSDRYNQMLLQFLSNQISVEDFMNSMHEFCLKGEKVGQGHHKKNVEESLVSILARHNAALVLFCSGRIPEARTLLLPLKTSLVDIESVQTIDLVSYYRANALFLLMDCSITFMDDADSFLEYNATREVEEIVSYVEKYVDITKCNEITEQRLEVDSADLASEHTMNAFVGAINEMKFRLHLYKTRIMLMSKDKESESNVQKQGKKEIKAALEMYQQWRYQEKLSLDADDSLETRRCFYDDSFSNTGRMNQCALLLKANLELLKSNPRKAMKLCTEARAVVERMREGKGEESNEDEDVYQRVVDESQYFNNMACLHFNAGKFNSALFYFRKALKLLSSSCKNSACFTQDGRSLAPSISEILHNNAICSLQVRQYINAYDCMAKCVSKSPERFAKKVSCWLYMGEACIGIYADNNALNAISDESLCPITVHGILGSDEDISQVQRAPLHRALFCLNNALHLCAIRDNSESLVRDNYIETIRVALAYVYLELGEASSALHASRKALSIVRNDRAPSGPSFKRLERLRLYACEASCILGNPNEALNFLDIDRINIDADLEQSQKYNVGMDSLPNTPNDLPDDAKELACIAACASYAAKHELDLAKTFADKAFAFNENSIKTRNALLYCLLKNGDTDAALQVLRMTNKT